MIFDTEIKMMSDTLEKMNDLLGPENRLNGRCLHVQRGNPLFLVIEDLAPLGFRMVTPKTNLDLDHCLLAIQNLARFHASSVAVCEKVWASKNSNNSTVFFFNTCFCRNLTSKNCTKLGYSAHYCPRKQLPFLRVRFDSLQMRF